MFYMLALLVIFLGFIRLQIFLSSGKNKWLGFILPGLCVLTSFIMVGSLVVFSTNHHTTSLSASQEVSSESEPSNMTISEETKDSAPVGEVPQDTVPTQAADTPSLIVQSLFILITINISTGILINVYKKCRKEQEETL